jgi:bacterioferritin-associated ferredoxin
MIVCSCNVFSDTEVKSVMASNDGPSRISQVYTSLGCSAKCGRCVRTVKAILDDYFRKPDEQIKRREQFAA